MQPSIQREPAVSKVARWTVDGCDFVKTITWKEHYLILAGMNDLRRAGGGMVSVSYNCVVDDEVAAAKCFWFAVKEVHKSKLPRLYGNVSVIAVGLKELLVVACGELRFYVCYLERRPL